MNSLNEDQANWTTAKDVRAQLMRLWGRGDMLRKVLSQALFSHDVEHSFELLGSTVDFPYKLKFKKPKSSDYGQRYADVRSWLTLLSKIRHTRVESVEIRLSQLGRNLVPESLWIDSIQDAIALIGKGRDVEGFVEIVRHTLRQPSEIQQVLIPWINKFPLKSLEYAQEWEQLLLVHSTIVRHADSALYLRQVSVSGVDTKFIEAHRSVLGEWLDFTMPAESINDQYTGQRGFAKRFGFRDKPVRTRLRSLDSERPLLVLPGQERVIENQPFYTADVTLDHSIVSLLNPQHSHIIITENEINYLSLPRLANTIAIFGSGYGLQAIGDIGWIKRGKVFYWGDIDTHGFAILNELRASLPEVKSLLMDSETLLAHESFWVSEPKPANRKLTRLFESEKTLYRELVENRFGVGVRLEQEQIDYQFVLSRLRAAGWDVVLDS